MTEASAFGFSVADGRNILMAEELNSYASGPRTFF